MRRAAWVLATAAAVARTSAYVYEDTFQSYNDVFWAQSTDIEHTDAGGGYEARPDHLLYTSNGLINLLDRHPCNQTQSGLCCTNTSSCAPWAAGHLRTNSFFVYGNYTWIARAAHPPALETVPVVGATDGPGCAGSDCPNNTVSCLSASYIGQPIHNEITLCFQPKRPATVDVAYWYDSTMHMTIVNGSEIVGPSFDPHSDFHRYDLSWRPDAIDLSIDERLVYSVKGKPPGPGQNATIPYIAGQGVIIVRPLTSEYQGDAALSVKYFRYESLQ